MFKWLLGLTLLAVLLRFYFFGLPEHWMEKLKWETSSQNLPSSNYEQTLENSQSVKKVQQTLAESKEKVKKEILEELEKIAQIKDPVKRRREASKMKKQLTKTIADWGNQPEDIRWMQDLISTRIRPLKN